MKTNALLAFFFFFSTALFAITTAEIVFDSDGNPLKNGGNYYLSPFPHIGGKGVAGAIIDHSGGSCSLAVVLKFYTEWPTIIASPNTTNPYITTDDPLWISFSQLPSNPCTNNSQWVVTQGDAVGETVMVGDASEFPFPLSGWFFIELYDRHDFLYTLVFCDEHGKREHVRHKHDSYGNDRLVVTEDEKVQLVVRQFVKKTSDEVVASDISMVV